MTAGSNWHYMTWKEVEAAAGRDPVVLVPAGTVETQGPNNYVGVEHIYPERLAQDAAKSTNAVVVPTIPYGWSPDFEGYPGTISIRPATLQQVYEDVARSIVRHGFDHVLFLVTHINNQPPVEEAAYNIRREFGVDVAWVNPAAMANQAWQDLGPDFPTGKGHGADTGLSLGAYLAPDAVDLSTTQMNDDKGDYGTLAYGLPFVLEDFSKTIGGFGDATHASVERGKLWYDEVLRRLIILINEYGQRPAPRSRKSSGVGA
jgi:creatinine amidohydrolase